MQNPSSQAEVLRTNLPLEPVNPRIRRLFLLNRAQPEHRPSAPETPPDRTKEFAALLRRLACNLVRHRPFSRQCRHRILGDGRSGAAQRDEDDGYAAHVFREEFALAVRVDA